VAGAEVAGAGPVQVGGRDVEAAGDGPDAPQRVEADRDDFGADAVTGDDGQPDGLRYFGTVWANVLS
jgi:hypothetical protein